LGYGEWGRKMQDDLVDATEWLIDQGIANPDRICIIGGSYGGYASLMGAALTPDLYQCAFAFAPVTDIYKLVQKFSGTSEHDFYKKAVANSKRPESYNRRAPINFAGEINIPVLLMHGDKDSTVDIEHSERMAKALKKAKKDYRFIILEGEGHGVVEEKHRFIYFRNLENFLAKYLGQTP